MSASLRARLAGWRRRRRLGRRELDRLESRVVWIFGSPRTGSTWLMQMLGEAPAPGAATLDEPWVGELLNRPYVLRKQGGEEFVVASTDEAHRERTAWILARGRAEIWRPWIRGLILEGFRDQILHGAARTGWKRPLLIVKDPNSSDAAEEVVRAMPRSRMIFLMRDGRDVIDSIMDLFANPSWGIQAEMDADGLRPSEREEFLRGAAAHWVYRTEVVQRAVAALGPEASITVRYEDLLARTASELARVGRWLGFSDADRWAAEVAPRHSFELVPSEQRGSGKFHRAATPGLWRSSFSEPEQRILDQVMGEKLHELGYT